MQICLNLLKTKLHDINWFKSGYKWEHFCIQMCLSKCVLPVFFQL